MNSVRNKQIDYFIDNYDITKFPYLNLVGDSENIRLFIIDYNLLKEKLKKRWKEDPEYRFIQLLIHNVLLPNVSGFWYYDTDESLLNAQNIDLSKYLTWTSILNKKGNRLKKPKIRFLYELDKEHIENILKTQTISIQYKTIFEKMLT